MLTIAISAISQFEKIILIWMSIIFHLFGMAETNRSKDRDANHLAKLIADIATGELLNGKTKRHKEL